MWLSALGVEKVKPKLVHQNKVEVSVGSGA